MCVCVFVTGCRAQEKDSHQDVPLAHFSWSLTRTRLDPKLWVLEPDKKSSSRISEKQMLGDFHRKSLLSSALSCLLMPHIPQKKKKREEKKETSSSFIKTYAFNHTSCLFHSGIHVYIPCWDRLLPCVLPSSHWSHRGFWQQWEQDLTHPAKLLDF